MRQSNIFSGAAFRATVISSVLFISALVLIGFAIYHITKLAMINELESQISEEVILFQQIHQQGGHTALMESIKQLEQQPAPIPSLIGFFDDSDQKLAGNSSLAPDFIGWKTITSAIEIQQSNLRYRAFAKTIDSSTLVVGRHMKLIDSVLEILTWVLILAGFFVCLFSLLTGYFSSRRVLFKLNRLAGTLDEISQGKTEKRLLIDNSNDQIDRISKQINHYLDQLSSLINSTKNTAVSIAHDLRTPLNRAIVKLQQVKDHQGSDAERFELLDQAETEMANVGDIFDTILRISRIENNKDRSKFEKLSVNNLLQDMFEIYQAVAEEGGQNLVYQNNNSDIFIVGDKKMLRQLLSNLIENAMFYCPENTTIKLACYTSSDQNGIIEVGDNGPGIPVQEREKVLDPFYRLTASRNQPGSGLGLALVKAIAIRHNARLELLDNHPGLRVQIEFID